MNLIKQEYSNIGEVLYSGTLPNGLQLRIIPKPGFSTYYAVFGTNYGGAMRRFEVDGKISDTPAGVAHFLEHKMFDMPTGENALSVFSENGADPNAFTSSSYTCYFFRCTNGFEDNLKLLLSFVSTPYFTPETVNKEQGIIGQEIQMGEDSPGSELYYNLLKALYKNHPIREKIAGTIDSIAEITDKTLYDCHKVFYAPSNMVLTVEGDVDPEKIYQIASESLTKDKASIPHADFGAPEDDYPVSSKIEKSMAVGSPMIIIGCKNAMAKGGKGLEDLKERMIGSVALRLFSGPSSPLFTRLYSSGLILNSLDGECDYAAGTSTIMISAEGPNPDRLLSEVSAEVETIRKNGFDNDYFKRTKKCSIGSQLRSYEDFDETCVNVCLAALDGFNIFDSYSLLEQITKEDCETWITENLKPERLAMSVISPLK